MDRTRADPRRHPTARLSPLLIAVACTAVLTLAGCAGSQGYGTDTETAAVNGASGNVGPIAVRDAVFAFPDRGSSYRPGQRVPLLVTIVNGGARAAELVTVTTPVARQVAVEGRTMIPAGFLVSTLPDADNNLRPVATPPPPSGAAPSASGAPSPSATPAPSASAAAPNAPPAAASPGPANSRAARRPSIDGGELRVVLTDLARPIRPGLTYPVTFHFRRAGQLTLRVPLTGGPESGAG